MSGSVLQMGLADVARLTGVQRPVVSMWRRRPLAGREFPEPIAVVGAQERFDAFEIADYLAATGRGNRTIEREDVAAHAALSSDSGLSGSALFDGLTAMLTLDVLSGEPLADLSADDLRALAAEADPEDRHLVSEVERLGGAASQVAGHAAALADASYSPRAALELLLRQQRHRGLPAHAAVAYQRDALNLGGQVAAALAVHAGWSTPLFVDVTDSSGDLLLESARAYDAETLPSVATLAVDTPTARLLRRRLAVHDLHRLDIGLQDGDYSLDSNAFDGAVHVVQLPPVAPAAMDDLQMLELVGDLLVQLDERSRMVVIGPASALSDPPASAELDRARDDVLRSGRLRAAIRLPAGLLVTQPRRHLAMWALGPAHPEVAIADRWTVVGDLSNADLDDVTTADIVTDVVAAMSAPRDAVAHAYRFARPVLTAVLIAGRGALTAKPPRRAGADVITVDDALAAKLCRVIPGNRVTTDDLTDRGRSVIGIDELIGLQPIGSRAVDPLSFPVDYPAARYTEPGDVVFTTTPRVAAWVDREGGSVVMSPARVIRTAPTTSGDALIADVIAADINAATTSSWRTWPLRLVPADRREHLQDELERTAGERAELLARIRQLDHHHQQLINDATRTPTEGR